MNNTPEITIIIPIHNRILFLPQALEYYSRARSHINLKIIIADSSSEENFDKNQKVIGKYEDLNIQHLSIRGAGQTLYDKIISALEHVETEFCVSCADDDFITISGLKETTEFLKNNPDFIVAHGEYISFHTRPNSGIQKLYWRSNYFNHSIDADSAQERLTDQFLNFKSVLYAVYRTNVLKDVFNEVRANLDTNVRILLFGELLSSMLAAIKGKIKDLNVFYAARREDAYYQGQHVKWPLIRDYAQEGKLEAEGVKFKECIVKNVLMESDLDAERARALMDEGLREFLSRGLPPDYFRHLVLNTANFLRNNNAPSWIYKGLSRIYRTLFPVKRGGYDKDLQGTNLTSYNDDFLKLRDVILEGRASTDI